MCVSYTLFPSSSPPSFPPFFSPCFFLPFHRQQGIARVSPARAYGFFLQNSALALSRRKCNVVSTFNMARTRAVTHEWHAQRAKVKRLEIKTRAIHLAGPFRCTKPRMNSGTSLSRHSLILKVACQLSLEDTKKLN